MHWSLDDWEQYAYLPGPPIGSTSSRRRRCSTCGLHELDAMRRHGCLFMLTCHPFLSGRPARVEMLRRLIEHALECGDVAFATAATSRGTRREDAGRGDQAVAVPSRSDAAIYPSDLVRQESGSSLVEGGTMSAAGTSPEAVQIDRARHRADPRRGSRPRRRRSSSGSGPAPTSRRSTGSSARSASSSG